MPKDILTYILDASEELKGDQDFGIEEMIDEFITFFIDRICLEMSSIKLVLNKKTKIVNVYGRASVSHIF